MTKTALLLFLTISLLSCKEAFKFDHQPDDEIIVKVHDKVLLKSQLKGLLHDGVSEQDSMNIINGFIENWIRENLMIIEAEKKVASDMDLNKLLADYRSSLLLYNYEKKLIEERLDTFVSDFQINEFYEINKDQYLLSHKIFKAIFGKFPSKYSGLSNFSKLLRRDDISEAVFIIKDHAVQFQTDLNKWYTREEILNLMPAGFNNGKADFSKKSILQDSDKNFEYFVKIMDLHDVNQIPPLDYIEDKLVKVILNNRKTELLKAIRQNLYNQARANNNIKIFNQ